MASIVKSEKRTKAYVIYTVVLVISLLFVTNAYLLYRNSQVIEYNKALQEQAERLKVNTLDIVRNLHQVDMGVRGYYLIGTTNQKDAANEAILKIEKVFSTLESTLKEQQFPMDRFYIVRDSIVLYFRLTDDLLKMIDNNQRKQFLSVLSENRGFFAWRTYRNFSAEINAFEDGIALNAKANYSIALRNSYLLQIILLVITIPSLFYMAFYTISAFSVSERLRISEEEKSDILERQKENLEVMVQERTNEILAQNEEITSHNEQLRFQQNKIEAQHYTLTEQNHQLLNAKKIIEDQNEIIRKKNEELILEVDRQTQDLIKANAELIEHNSRLEQFTYIISHNLRAPMARLVGLSTILNLTRNEDERMHIVQMMVKSTSELDNVIRDLSQILAIQKLSTQVYSEINLEEVILKVKDMLEEEIRETDTKISTDLQANLIYSLPQYVESIIYNLMSNAIKYRHPDRSPEIILNTVRENGFIKMEVSDNGLGLDLERHKNNLFNLYKRFHSHVEGKGLGLYLVRTQIEAIGGQIEVHSKVGQGTTFKLLIED